MDDVASTRAEANAHIQRLREARGITGDHNDISNGVLVSSLNEALNLLSDQLYTTPTHFILELIQNADDNTYSRRAVPRLHLSLYRKAGKEIFRSDCNEVGFTFRQLDALARIGKSTKKAADGRKGYIGEKGIGFKSVFKVADVVRVASGCYEFMFNRSNTIGMMLPIPFNFPSDDRVDDHTQFLLELKRNEDYQQIKGDLQELGSETLIFLRKLKQLDVSIDGERKTYQLRTDYRNSNFGGETATISEARWLHTRTTKYMIERQTVKNLPPDVRREAVATSEVVVAFAVEDRSTPIVTTQQVFAFLPIQNYGFPFLIHADFLLTASRESLEDQCPWNLALRNGIKDAVVKAICTRFLYLNEDGDKKGLCYSWPKYLVRQRSGSRFWDPLHHSILYALRDEQILQSRDIQSARCFQKPTVLRYVPEAYRFEGETLFDLPSINKTHLSFVYDHVYGPLRSIGVSQLSLNDLCEEFCQWVECVGIVGLKEKPDQWHSRVATIFCYQGDWIKNKLKRLPIIPLRHGSWVSAMEAHLYLPSLNENEHVPSGVNISIVAEDAVRDVSRRRFYEYLDIKEYNPGQVCKLILELHRGLASVWRTGRLTGEFIADAVYLFEHRSQLHTYGCPDIFFVVHKDGQDLAQRLPRIYMIDPNLTHGVIAKYKDTPGNPFAVLLNRYEAAFLENGKSRLLPDFREWLLRSKTIFATIPDLVRNSRLTLEWEFLRDQNVLDLLYVVRDQLSTTIDPSTKLVEAVPRLQVRCLDGESRMLGSLAVPTVDLTCRCPHLDFADLPEPMSQDWKFLSLFGVITEVDTTAILRELQALRQISVRDVDASAIRKLYEALNSDTRRSGDQIVRTFGYEPLVFVPRPEPKWLSHKDCVWTAHKLLTRVTKLKTYYRNCEVLFHSLLDVKEAGIQHVVDEFCEPTSREDNIEQHFKAMLSLLARSHRNANLTDDQVRKIRSASSFPILAKGFTSVEGLSRTEMRSLRDKNWYIPDTVTFESAFRGKIDMLALPVQSTRALKGLFADLGCEGQFLSEAVTRTITPDGMPVRNVCEEQDLRRRLRYIFRVVEGGNLSGEIPDISSIQVWSVPSITVKMLLDDVEVTIEDELVTIEESGDEINIYLREGIHESRKTEVTYELVKHFKEMTGFDEKLTTLIDLLMGASINRLPGILDKHDIPLPDGSPDNSDVGSREETPDLEDDEALTEEDNIHSDGSDGSHESRMDGFSGREDSSSAATEFTPTESGTGTDSERRRASSLVPAAHLQHATPLRELIPSHQSRSERIIQRANRFRLSDAEAASPIQHHSESGAAPFRSPLPIRTRTTGNSAGENEGSSPHGISANGGSYSRGLGVGEGGGGGFSISTSRRESSGATHNGRADGTSETRTRVIGYFGELFVFEMFNQQIDDWTFECWTSRLRSEAGHPRFRGHEGDFSDFTYVDAFGKMRAMLHDVGVEPNAAWSNTTKFHLEVKSTLGSCGDPMFVSQNQVDKMREFNGTADDAYILLRVFDLDDGRNPGVKFFRDPWSLYINGVLHFRSDEGYKVYQ